jgi:hypothetical protein
MLPEQMNRGLRGATAFALAASLCASHVAAGVAVRPAGGLIIGTTSHDTVTGRKRTQRTILSGRMVRTEEDGQSSIVSPDLGSLWESSAQGQTCVRYSAADMAGRRQAAEEERRRTIASIAASAPTPDAPDLPASRSLTGSVSYRKLASGEVAGKWTCDRFAKEIHGIRMSEVCVVPYAALKLTRGDFAGLADAGRVFGAAPSTWDQETLSLLENATTIGYDAFPVRIEVFDGSGRARFVSELSSLAFRRIPSRAFEAPARCTAAATIPTP